MTLLRPARRFCLIASFALFFAAHAHAQLTNVTNDQATPIPGAGHDYIKMLNETVSPGNGQVSLRIDMSAPKARKLGIPYAWLYSSAGTAIPNTNWADSSPLMTAIQGAVSVFNPTPPQTYTCEYISNYMLQDLAGTRHALNISIAQVGNGGTSNCNLVSGRPTNYLVGGDGTFQAITTAPGDGQTNFIPNPVTLSDLDGTVYYFPWNALNGGFIATPSYIKDRNGNILQWTTSGGNVVIVDDAGRSAVTISPHVTNAPSSSVNVSGLPNSFAFHWINANYTYNLNYTLVYINGTCPTQQNGAHRDNIQTLTLPNGQAYSFQYDSVYGNLSKITYPNGGYISYTWGANPQSESLVLPNTNNDQNACIYRYDLPVVTHRYVSFDGVNIAWQQDFSYSMNWVSSSSSLWLTKQTTVTTKDCARNSFNCATAPSFTTVYNYSPILVPPAPNVSAGVGQAAVEQTVTYKDWTGSTLRTVTKGWLDQYRLGCELSTLDSGAISGTFYIYGSGTQVTNKKDYDYGLITSTSACPTAPNSITPPTGVTTSRETAITYQTFPNTPIFPSGPSIFDRPCKVMTYGNGTLVAESDSLYDGQTGTTPCSAAVTQTLSGAGNYAGHDETLYGTTASVPRGNVTKILRKCLQSCTDSTTTLTYDETGQVLTSKDANNNTTQYSYADSYYSPPSSNTNAYLTQITGPLGHISKFKYAYSDGQLIQSQDQNDINASRSGTTYTYTDSLRRLTQTNYADGGQTTYSYNDTAPSPSVTTTRLIATTPSTVNLSSTAIMDGLGHVTQTQLTTDPDGQTSTDMTYDGLGRVRTQTNPHRSTSATTDGTTTNFYDALGRVCLVVPPDGTLPTGSTCPTSQPSNTIFTTYSGNTTTVTDQVGKSRKSVTDGLGRLTQVFEDPGTSPHLNYETDYAYDVLNNLLSVNQKGNDPNSANWRTRTFTYNSLSQLLTASNPESGTISYVYDANGNLSTKTSPKPNQTGSATVVATYTYDALNRLTQKSFNDGPPATPTVKYGYDGTALTGCTTAPPSLTITNGIGRRTGMCDAAGSEAWSFDSLGRIAADARTTNALTNTFSYTYNLDGSPLTEVHPINALTINYVQGGAGRLVSETSSDASYAYNVHYTPGGALCYMNSAWGQYFTHVWTFNSRLQPARIQIYGTGHGPANSVCPAASTDTTVGLDLGYTYTDASGHNNGNVTTIANNILVDRTQSFSYDSLNRLTSAWTAGINQPWFPGDTDYLQDCWAENYSYDPWGNLLKLGPSGSSSYTGCTQESGFDFSSPGSIAANNRIATSGYVYDAAGNLTTSPGAGAVTFNAENQMVSAGGLVYAYDGDGKRVTKAPSATPTQPNYIYWYGAGTSPVIETNGAGVFQYRYISFNGMRVSREEANDWVDHYGLDALGNVRTVYGTNGASDASDYYPFGGERVVQSNTNNHYKFTSKERDSESGLDNFAARFDSSTLGRFMRPDDPNADQDASDPQSWNLYSYVRNNPLNNTDPTGNACVSNDGGKTYHDDKSGGQTCKEAQKPQEFEVKVKRLPPTLPPAEWDLLSAFRCPACPRPPFDKNQQPLGAPVGPFGPIGSLASETPAELSILARFSAILRAAGSKGMGPAAGEAVEVTAAEAEELGKAWVGPGARVASDGKTLVSSDGLRVYRPPTFKPGLSRVQANLEQKVVSGGRPVSNFHLDIK